MKRFARVLVCGGAVVPCIALAQLPQSGRATVRILDPRGRPVPHAVLDVGGGVPRVSDDSGRIALTVDRDSLTIRVRRLGFTPFFGQVGVSPAGVIDVTLEPLAQSLAPVTVETARDQTPLEKTGFYDRVRRAQRGAYNAEFVTPEELDARQGASLSSLFQGRRFVKVRPGGYRQSYLEGRGGCAMTILLDGQRILPEPPRGAEGSKGPDPTAPKDGTPAQRAGTERGAPARSYAATASIVPIDQLATLGSVAAIEMYPSAALAPVELIPISSSCGIVAIWTGSRR